MPGFSQVSTTHLILLAHGSRDPRWQEPFQRFLAQQQEQWGTDGVTLAYMEMAEPTLEQQVAQAVSAGATEIWILPLFMAAGGHLRNDVPAQIRGLKATYPNVVMALCPPVGEFPKVVAAMDEVVENLMRQDPSRSQLNSVMGEFQRF